MRSKKALVVLVVSVTLVFNVALPSRARATDTAVLVIGSIVLFVGFVVAGALLTRQKGPFTLQPTPEDLSKTQEHRDAVHFGTGCPMNDGRPALACW
jgi:hypothetical protein